MFAVIRSFFARHPVLRDAVLWGLPAVLLGLFLRLLFLHYSPYAYWGSDSRSYYSFAHKLLSEGYISLDEKRRYLYPILMAVVSILPGAALKWLAWLQHGFGVLTLLPLAYIVRKCFVHWKLWIVPVTVIYAGFPMILWYEHEMLGETVFFAMLLWAFAGWVAWVGEPRLERSRRLFWWFFVPLALFLITKPSGRFVWPGIACGLLMVFAWRKLDWRHWAAIAALIVVTLTVGSKKQGAWLAYVATFPLTQLDSPLHAEYKAQIRDMVEPLRRDLDVYYELDEGPFAFLEDPSKEANRPLWQALAKDQKMKARIYTDLAIEAIKSEPLLFLYLAFQRVVKSINPSEFKEDRFTGGYYVERFEHFYDELGKRNRTPMDLLFGMPRGQQPPPYAEFAKKLSPAPNSWAEGVVVGWVRAFDSVSDFVHLPQQDNVAERQLTKARPTFLGWWLLAGIALSFLRPYWRTLGVWTLVALAYVFGVFLVSQPNPRYFGAVWPILVVLLAVPADVLMSLIFRRKNPSAPAVEGGSR